MSHRRGASTASARGFTLVEIMIALSLAGLLVAGAFQLHATFTAQSQRQRQLTDMQQSLRLAMQIIERSIRGSGGGFVNGRVIIAPGCSGTRTLYRAQYYNTNAWPTGGAFTLDTTAGNADTDPDILRIIGSAESGVNLATADTGTVATVRGDATNIAVQDLLLFVNTTTATATTATGCFRQVTAKGATTGSPGSTPITHGTSPAYLCANTDTACTTAITYPTPVRRFRNQTFFRIVPPPAGSRESGKLAVAIVPIGDPPANPTWNIIADDIEDMQIALMMADGRVCRDVDDPALCDPAQASAVRVTLTARTLSAVPGRPPSQSGGYEDRSRVDETDGRLRRSLTSEIGLRN